MDDIGQLINNPSFYRWLEGVFSHDDTLILKAHSHVRDNFWATGSPLKMMKNAFHFTSKVLFVLKIFKFLT